MRRAAGAGHQPKLTKVAGQPFLCLGPDPSGSKRTHLVFEMGQAARDALSTYLKSLV